MESIFVLLLPLFLFLLLDTLCSQVLLKLTFVDTMLVFCVFESDLGLFLQIGELVSVLEHQVHQPLHVNLDFDLLFLLEVLQLPVLVAQFSIFIL